MKIKANMTNKCTLPTNENMRNDHLYIKKHFFSMYPQSQNPWNCANPTGVSAECKHLTGKKVRIVCDCTAHSEYLQHFCLLWNPESSLHLNVLNLLLKVFPSVIPLKSSACQTLVGVKKHACIQVIVGNWSPSTRQHQFVHAVAPFSICSIHYHMFVPFGQGAKHRKSLLQPILEYI